MTGCKLIHQCALWEGASGINCLLTDLYGREKATRDAGTLKQDARGAGIGNGDVGLAIAAMTIEARLHRAPFWSGSGCLK